MSSATPTPTTAPKAAGTSTLPPPQSLPEKQKRARDVGGGQSPRHNRTSDVKSALPRVPPTYLKPALPNPPTSNTPTPTPMASEWRVAVCTHRKQCLVQGLLRPPNLIPSPQQQRPLRKEARTSSRLASEPPTRLDLHPKPQRSRGSWESPVLSLTPEVQSVSSEIYQQEKKNTWEGDGGSSVYEGEFLSPPAAPWPWGGEKASLPAGT